MSAEFPMFIFVGTTTRREELSALASDRGMHVYDEPADPLYGTLAQVVAFFPDAVVIEDMGDELTRDVTTHLNSIHFEPMIVLSDTPAAWALEQGARIAVLPRDANAYEIFNAMRALLADAEPMWA